MMLTQPRKGLVQHGSSPRSCVKAVVPGYILVHLAGAPHLRVSGGNLGGANRAKGLLSLVVSCGLPQ